MKPEKQNYQGNAVGKAVRFVSDMSDETYRHLLTFLGGVIAGIAMAILTLVLFS